MVGSDRSEVMVITHENIVVDVVEVSCSGEFSNSGPVGGVVASNGLSSEFEAGVGDCGVLLPYIGLCSSGGGWFGVCSCTKVAFDCGESGGLLEVGHQLPVFVASSGTTLALTSDSGDCIW